MALKSFSASLAPSIDNYITDWKLNVFGFRSDIAALGQDQYHYFIGAFLGILDALGWAVGYVTCSFLTQRRNCSVELFLFYNAICSLIVSLMSSMFDPDHQILSARVFSISTCYWVGVVSVAFLGISATFMVNKAVVWANPVLVSFIRVLDIVISYTIQVVFLHQIPDRSGMAGSILVVIGVSLLASEDLLLPIIPEKIRLFL